MSFLLTTMFSLLLPHAVSAEGDAKPAPSAASTPAALSYELRELHPAGFTQYSASGEVIRQYFDFQNEQGTHHVIYEEVASAAPNRALLGLRQAAAAYDSVCSLDLECTAKAFCTADCRHLYYETANAPGDALSPDRNKCRVTFFACEKSGAARNTAVTATAPAPSSAPVPAASN